MQYDFIAIEKFNFQKMSINYFQSKSGKSEQIKFILFTIKKIFECSNSGKKFRANFSQ